MGSRYQPDSDNICSGLTDSNGTPFSKRFRTRKHGNPRTVLYRHSPRIHCFLVLCAPVLLQRENAAPGHYRNRVGNGSHVLIEHRPFDRHLFRTLGIGFRFNHAGISDDICETIPSLPTRNSQHYPFIGSEVGISLGIATACYMELDTDKMLHTGQMVASIALLFFVLVTYPYYIKKKVR